MKSRRPTAPGDVRVMAGSAASSHACQDVSLYASQSVCRIHVSGCRVLATAAAEECVGTAVVTGWAPAIRQPGSEQNEEAHFTLQHKSGAVYVPLQQASLTCGATPVQLDTDLPRCRTLCSEDW